MKCRAVVTIQCPFTLSDPSSSRNLYNPRHHLDWHASRRANLGLAALLFCAALVQTCLFFYDREWTLWIRENAHPEFGEWMRRSLFEGNLPGGSDPATLFLLFCLLLYLKSAGPNSSARLRLIRPQLGFILLSGLAGALGVVHSLKWVIGRARPFEVWYHQWPYSRWYEFGPHYITEGIYSGSFPSGHTAAALSLMAFVYILSARKKHSWVSRGGVFLLSLLVLVSAFGMGVARSMTAHHWVTDSLGMILPIWAVQHAIFFHLLKVPQQLAYLDVHKQYPNLPNYWELRLAALALPVVLGLMAIVLGFRSLMFQETPWLLGLSVVGVALVTYFLPRFKALYFGSFSFFLNPESGDESA